MLVFISRSWSTSLSAARILACLCPQVSLCMFCFSFAFSSTGPLWPSGDVLQPALPQTYVSAHILSNNPHRPVSRSALEMTEGKQGREHIASPSGRRHHGERVGTRSMDRKAESEKGHRARHREATSPHRRQEAGGTKSDCAPALP